MSARSRYLAALNGGGNKNKPPAPPAPPAPAPTAGVAGKFGWSASSRSEQRQIARRGSQSPSLVPSMNSGNDGGRGDAGHGGADQNKSSSSSLPTPSRSLRSAPSLADSLSASTSSFSEPPWRARRSPQTNKVGTDVVVAADGEQTEYWGDVPPLTASASGAGSDHGWNDAATSRVSPLRRLGDDRGEGRDRTLSQSVVEERDSRVSILSEDAAGEARYHHRLQPSPVSTEPKPQPQPQPQKSRWRVASSEDGTNDVPRTSALAQTPTPLPKQRWRASVLGAETLAVDHFTPRRPNERRVWPPPQEVQPQPQRQTVGNNNSPWKSQDERPSSEAGSSHSGATSSGAGSSFLAPPSAVGLGGLARDLAGDGELDSKPVVVDGDKDDDDVDDYDDDVGDLLPPVVAAFRWRDQQPQKKQQRQGGDGASFPSPPHGRVSLKRWEKLPTTAASSDSTGSDILSSPMRRGGGFGYSSPSPSGVPLKRWENSTPPSASSDGSSLVRGDRASFTSQSPGGVSLKRGDKSPPVALSSASAEGANFSSQVHGADGNFPSPSPGGIPLERVTSPPQPAPSADGRPLSAMSSSKKNSFTPEEFLGVREGGSEAGGTASTLFLHSDAMKGGGARQQVPVDQDPKKQLKKGQQEQLHHNIGGGTGLPTSPVLGRVPSKLWEKISPEPSSDGESFLSVPSSPFLTSFPQTFKSARGVAGSEAGTATSSSLPSNVSWGKTALPSFPSEAGLRSDPPEVDSRGEGEGGDKDDVWNKEGLGISPQVKNQRQPWDPERDIPRGKVAEVLSSSVVLLDGTNSVISDVVSTTSSALHANSVKRIQWDARRDIPAGKVGAMAAAMFGGGDLLVASPPPPPPHQMSHRKSPRKTGELTLQGRNIHNVSITEEIGITGSVGREAVVGAEDEKEGGFAADISRSFVVTSQSPATAPPPRPFSRTSPRATCTVMPAEMEVLSPRIAAQRMWRARAHEKTQLQGLEMTTELEQGSTPAPPLEQVEEENLKLEPDADPNSEMDPEPDADLKSETEPDVDLKLEQGPEPELEAGLNSEPKTGSKSEPDSETDLNSEPERKADLNLEPELEADPNSEQKLEAGPELYPEPEADPKSDLEADPKSEPEPEANLKWEPEPEADPKWEPEPEADPKSEPEPEADPKSEPEPEVDPKSEPKPKLKLEVDPKSELRPAAVAKTVIWDNDCEQWDLRPDALFASRLDDNIDLGKGVDSIDFEAFGDVIDWGEGSMASAATKEMTTSLVAEEVAPKQEARFKFMLESKPEPEPEPESESMLKLELELLPKPEIELMPKAEATSETGSEVDPVLEPMPMPEPMQVQMLMLEPILEPKLKPVLNPELKLETKPEIVLKSALEKVTERKPEVEQEREKQVILVKRPKLDPGQELELEQKHTVTNECAVFPHMTNLPAAWGNSEYDDNSQWGFQSEPNIYHLDENKGSAAGKFEKMTDWGYCGTDTAAGVVELAESSSADDEAAWGGGDTFDDDFVVDNLISYKSLGSGRRIAEHSMVEEVNDYDGFAVTHDWDLSTASAFTFAPMSISEGEVRQISTAAVVTTKMPTSMLTPPVQLSSQSTATASSRRMVAVQAGGDGKEGRVEAGVVRQVEVKVPLLLNSFFPPSLIEDPKRDSPSQSPTLSLPMSQLPDSRSVTTIDVSALNTGYGASSCINPVHDVNTLGVGAPDVEDKKLAVEREAFSKGKDGSALSLPRRAVSQPALHGAPKTRETRVASTQGLPTQSVLIEAQAVEATLQTCFVIEDVVTTGRQTFPVVDKTSSSSKGITSNIGGGKSGKGKRGFVMKLIKFAGGSKSKKKSVRADSASKTSSAFLEKEEEKKQQMKTPASVSVQSLVTNQNPHQKEHHNQYTRSGGVDEGRCPLPQLQSEETQGLPLPQMGPFVPPGLSAEKSRGVVGGKSPEGILAAMTAPQPPPHSRSPHPFGVRDSITKLEQNPPTQIKDGGAAGDNGGGVRDSRSPQEDDISIRRGSEGLDISAPDKCNQRTSKNSFHQDSTSAVSNRLRSTRLVDLDDGLTDNDEEGGSIDFDDELATKFSSVSSNDDDGVSEMTNPTCFRSHSGKGEIYGRTGPEVDEGVQEVKVVEKINMEEAEGAEVAALAITPVASGRGQYPGPRGGLVADEFTKRWSRGNWAAEFTPRTRAGPLTAHHVKHAITRCTVKESHDAAETVKIEGDVSSSSMTGSKSEEREISVSGGGMTSQSLATRGLASGDSTSKVTLPLPSFQQRRQQRGAINAGKQTSALPLRSAVDLTSISPPKQFMRRAPSPFLTARSYSSAEYAREVSQPHEVEKASLGDERSDCIDDDPRLRAASLTTYALRKGRTLSGSHKNPKVRPGASGESNVSRRGLRALTPVPVPSRDEEETTLTLLRSDDGKVEMSALGTSEMTHMERLGVPRKLSSADEETVEEKAKDVSRPYKPTVYRSPFQSRKVPTNSGDDCSYGSTAQESIKVKGNPSSTADDEKKMLFRDETTATEMTQDDWSDRAFGVSLAIGARKNAPGDEESSVTTDGPHQSGTSYMHVPTLPKRTEEYQDPSSSEPAKATYRSGVHWSPFKAHMSGPPASQSADVDNESKDAHISPKSKEYKKVDYEDDVEQKRDSPKKREELLTESRYENNRVAIASIDATWTASSNLIHEESKKEAFEAVVPEPTMQEQVAIVREVRTKEELYKPEVKMTPFMMRAQGKKLSIKGTGARDSGTKIYMEEVLQGIRDISSDEQNYIPPIQGRHSEQRQHQSTVPRKITSRQQEQVPNSSEEIEELQGELSSISELKKQSLQQIEHELHFLKKETARDPYRPSVHLSPFMLKVQRKKTPTDEAGLLGVTKIMPRVRQEKQCIVENNSLTSENECMKEEVHDEDCALKETDGTSSLKKEKEAKPYKPIAHSSLGMSKALGKKIPVETDINWESGVHDDNQPKLSIPVQMKEVAKEIPLFKAGRSDEDLGRTKQKLDRPMIHSSPLLMRFHTKKQEGKLDRMNPFIDVSESDCSSVPLSTNVTTAHEERHVVGKSSEKQVLTAIGELPDLLDTAKADNGALDPNLAAVVPEEVMDLGSQDVKGKGLHLEWDKASSVLTEPLRHEIDHLSPRTTRRILRNKSKSENIQARKASSPPSPENRQPRSERVMSSQHSENTIAKGVGGDNSSGETINRNIQPGKSVSLDNSIGSSPKSDSDAEPEKNITHYDSIGSSSKSDSDSEPEKSVTLYYDSIGSPSRSDPESDQVPSPIKAIRTLSSRKKAQREASKMHLIQKSPQELRLQSSSPRSRRLRMHVIQKTPRQLRRPSRRTGDQTLLYCKPTVIGTYDPVSGSSMYFPP